MTLKGTFRWSINGGLQVLFKDGDSVKAHMVLKVVEKVYKKVCSEKRNMLFLSIGNFGSLLIHTERKVKEKIPDLGSV